MRNTTPRCRLLGAAALVAGSLVVALLATGLGAVAFASGHSANSRPPAITGSIHLRHRDVQSGRSVRGELVFENHTANTKVLTRGCKIDGLYAIGLRASDGYISAPVFSVVGCFPEQKLVAKPGTTVYRFELRTSYTVCSQSAKDQPPRSSKDWIPLCRKDSSGERDLMPRLPAGKYRTVFFPAGRWHGPHVKPAHLVVTKAN